MVLSHASQSARAAGVSRHSDSSRPIFSPAVGSGSSSTEQPSGQSGGAAMSIRPFLTTPWIVVIDLPRGASIPYSSIAPGDEYFKGMGKRGDATLDGAKCRVPFRALLGHP